MLDVHAATLSSNPAFNKYPGSEFKLRLSLFVTFMSAERWHRLQSAVVLKDQGWISGRGDTMWNSFVSVAPSPKKNPGSTPEDGKLGNCC